MRILQINAVYGTKSTGTIVKEIQELCAKNSIEAYVAYSTCPPLLKNSNKLFQIGTLLDKKLHGVLSRMFGMQAYYSRIATWHFLRWLDRLQPQVVHLHNLHSNYINLNALLKYLAEKDIPTVITMHDCWYFTGGCFHYTSVSCERWKNNCGACPKRYKDTPAYILDASERILNDRIEYLSRIPQLTFVGCSEWILGQLQQSRLANCGDKLCIHNGFDLDVFKPKPTNLKEELGLSGRVVILGPASKWLLPENKDTLDYFIKNMKDNMTLLLFGYCGPHIQIADNVRFYEYTASPKKMAELYSASDVMVNCSREDTLSSLNIEVQACGTPVVTYDATGSKETVDGICGFAVETGNYKELYNSTIEVIEKDKTTISIHCRNFVKLKFDKLENYQKYIALYKQIAY